jgi:hypothetical protein
VFSILFAYGGFPDNDSIYLSKQGIEKLIDEAQYYNFIPCICPITSGGPILDGWHMVNAITYDEIDVDELVGYGNDVWSEWEYDNYGIKEVLSFLKENAETYGFTDTHPITNAIGHPIACGWEDKEEKEYFAFVRTIPAGLYNEPYEISKSLLADLTDCTLYYVEIRVCSQWNTLDFNDMYIPRIAPIYKSKIVFEPWEEALKNHPNILIYDEE